MKYNYSKEVRDNDDLRESFNNLARQTFGFMVLKGTSQYTAEIYVKRVE